MLTLVPAHSDFGFPATQIILRLMCQGEGEQGSLLPFQGQKLPMCRLQPSVPPDSRVGAQRGRVGRSRLKCESE